MFSLKVVDTDEFLDMPPTTQNLYFHLGMRADDDGFVASPKKITKIINSADDDMKILLAKKFIIPFESGVCVIKHWKIHNFIRRDRYTETEYKEEKKLLTEQDNKYKLDNNKTNVIPNGNQRLTQVRLGQDRIGKNIIASKLAHTTFFEKNKKTINEILERKSNTSLTEKLYDWRWVVKNAEKDPRLYFIALYWEIKEYEFDNIKEAEGEIRRVIRKATIYSKKYDVEKIQDMLEWINEDAGKKGYSWTFETLDKKLGEFNYYNSKKIIK